jgi:hypothetical protein
VAKRNGVNRQLRNSSGGVRKKQLDDSGMYIGGASAQHTTAVTMAVLFSVVRTRFDSCAQWKASKM